MIIASQNSGSGDFKLPPAGTHAARCIQVIDLGTHHDEYIGKPKTQHKVRVNFELPDEKAVFDEKKGEEPFFVGVDYTLNLGEKSNLRRDLESWRGRPFSEDELEGFDISKLIGVPAMVSLIHRKSAAGKDYSKITGIAKMPKGMICPEQINPSLEFSLGEINSTKFSNLPNWIQNKIKESDEYIEASKSANSAKTVEEELKEPAGGDIPF